MRTILVYFLQLSSFLPLFFQDCFPELSCSRLSLPQLYFSLFLGSFLRRRSKRHPASSHLPNISFAHKTWERTTQWIDRLYSSSSFFLLRVWPDEAIFLPFFFFFFLLSFFLSVKLVLGTSFFVVPPPSSILAEDFKIIF